jgi:hypothetical protein
VAFEIGKTDALQHFARPLLPFRLGQTAHFQAKLDISKNSFPREKRVVLEDHAAFRTGPAN